MGADHSQYKFSVTIRSHDLAVVGCLRALSQYSQKTGNIRIPSGGTKDADWRRDHHCVTFHFSTTEYRQAFVLEANRLLLEGSWEVTGMRDDDPARPHPKG